MTSLIIEESCIPRLDGKVAIITGGASGIGYATAKILATSGAKVHILDLNLPDESDNRGTLQLEFIRCNVANWSELRLAFQKIGHVDMAFANAGISEETDYFQDRFEDNGLLAEPAYPVLDVNLRAVINFVKLSWSVMRRDGTRGSIVITTSATAYAPEQSLPVYAAAKLALVGLVRALRSTIIRDGITINAVAPAATITNLLPAVLAKPIIAAGLPVSSAHLVGLALVYSATAKETRRVQAYGKDKEEEDEREGRWNGRVILTLGNRYTELEEPISRLRGEWFGKNNLEDTRMQQAMTDFR
ncbi:MAG: hypothetical protein Q9187_000383 [Circinaria calcarea]